MEKTRKPIYRWLLIATLISVVIFAPGGFYLTGAAQAVEQFDPTLLSEASIPPIEFRGDAFVPIGRMLFPPSVTRAALQAFLIALSNYLGKSKAGQSLEQEYEALCQTIKPFLESVQFDPVIRNAQLNHDPIELVFLSPKPLENSRMIYDFSRAFRPHSRFGLSEEMIPSTVSISLANSVGKILIKVERSHRESVYVLNPLDGSSFRRYERPL